MFVFCRLLSFGLNSSFPHPKMQYLPIYLYCTMYYAAAAYSTCQYVMSVSLCLSVQARLFESKGANSVN